MKVRHKFPTGLHDLIVQRDRQCFAHRIDPRHQCRDEWGDPHSPYDLVKLTVEHINDGGAIMGKRAPDDPAHLVALCGDANVGGPSRELRWAARDYLRGIA